MARLVVLGERARVAGFALAGAEVVVAETPQAVRSAVKGLDDDAVLLLTSAAAAACPIEGEVDGERLVAVMPP